MTVSSANGNATGCVLREAHFAPTTPRKSQTRCVDWLQTCAITMNMMAGPPCFKRAIVQVGEARSLLHPNLSQDLDRSADTRYSIPIHICVRSTERASFTTHYGWEEQPEVPYHTQFAVPCRVASINFIVIMSDAT